MDNTKDNNTPPEDKKPSSGLSLEEPLNKEEPSTEPQKPEESAATDTNNNDTDNAPAPSAPTPTAPPKTPEQSTPPTPPTAQPPADLSNVSASNIPPSAPSTPEPSAQGTGTDQDTNETDTTTDEADTITAGTGPVTETRVQPSGIKKTLLPLIGIGAIAIAGGGYYWMNMQGGATTPPTKTAPATNTAAPIPDMADPDPMANMPPQPTADGVMPEMPEMAEDTATNDMDGDAPASITDLMETSDDTADTADATDEIDAGMPDGFADNGNADDLALPDTADEESAIPSDDLDTETDALAQDMSPEEEDSAFAEMENMVEDPDLDTMTDADTAADTDTAMDIKDTDTETMPDLETGMNDTAEDLPTPDTDADTATTAETAPPENTSIEEQITAIEQADDATAPDTDNLTSAEAALLDNQEALEQLQPSPEADDQSALAEDMTTTPPAPTTPQGTETQTAPQTLPTGTVGTNAVVRPLPKKYMIVTKDHSASSSTSQLAAARRALSENRYEAALQMFNTLAQTRSYDEQVLMGRAVSLHKLGRNNDAMEAYQQVLSKNPRNLEALSNMLGILRVERPQAIVGKLETLHDTYPVNDMIAAQLAVTYGDLKQYDQALEKISIATSLAPNNASHMFNKAVILDRMGQSQKAFTAYQTALEIHRQDTTGQSNIPVQAIQKRLGTLR